MYLLKTEPRTLLFKRKKNLVIFEGFSPELDLILSPKTEHFDQVQPNTTQHTQVEKGGVASSGGAK